MSKKHYVALANVYAAYRDQIVDRSTRSVTDEELSLQLETFDAMVSVTAGVMADDNRLFDRERFLQAVYGQAVHVTPHPGTKE